MLFPFPSSPRSHGNQEVLSQKYCPNLGCPWSLVCPCAVPRVQQPVGPGGQSAAESPSELRAANRTQHSPLLLSKVSLPLDIATAGSSPLAFYFPLICLKVTLSLKRKVLIFIQRKNRASSSSLSLFPKASTMTLFKLHVHCS
ncbi:hypothetical protein NQD34_004696 [Periophthalmus magnuspinnatus]|nr:hypothetical protein NQD34_004696 [Periophthalmus magnuspinnatus]